METEENIIDAQYSPLPPAQPVIMLTPEPGPDNPPWGPFTAIGVWIASIAFILVIPSLFLLPYLATLKPPITDTDRLIEFAKTDPTSLFLQIVAILPAHLLTVLVAWLVVTRFRKYSFRKMIGWETGGVKWWYYVAFLAGFLAVAGVVSHYVPEQENDLIRVLQSSRAAVYIVAFVATFTAPFVEEVVYRGIVYSAFQRTFGVAAAFIFTTLLFALVHVPQYYPSYSTIFLLTLLSLTLTFVRVKSGNLLPCIILHTAFNGMQSLLLILQPISSPEVNQQAAVILHHLK